MADWNGRAARRAEAWSERAILFGIVHTSSRVAGLGSLVLLGVFGNVLAAVRGYRMASHPWLGWANGLWILMVVAMLGAVLPGARALATAAQAASRGETPAAYEGALKRWRLGNIALSLLYLAMLVLMVFRPGA